MLAQHLNRCLTEDQRARWVELLCQSASDAGLPADAEFQAAFRAYLEWGSRLALENSQPGAQPPAHMPMPRWWWACDATPDARTPALGEREPPSAPDVQLPDEGVPLDFESHIKPLFRARDRSAMKFAFDLWAADDVRKHAHEILARLENGSMPCDGPWPPEKTAVFRRWSEGAQR